MQAMQAHLGGSSSKALQQEEILRERLLGPESAAWRAGWGAKASRKAQAG